LASLLPAGAVSALAYAQVIYLLPVSLFGMSVSAAELPNMSKAKGTRDEINSYLRERLNQGLSQIAYFIIPSVICFLLLGDVIVALLFESGAFTHDSTIFVWGVLAGSSIGLLATTLGRLYASTYYALRDTRTPLKFAIVRVVLTTSLGYVFALKVPDYFHLPQTWGTAGLTATAGFSGWIEFLLLRAKLNKMIGKTGLPFSFSAKLWISAFISGLLAYACKIRFQFLHSFLAALICFSVFGLSYLILTLLLKIPESQKLVRRFKMK
jgi:putative peptidoglycan lipid II flippase